MCIPTFARVNFDMDPPSDSNVQSQLAEDNLNQVLRNQYSDLNNFSKDDSIKRSFGKVVRIVKRVRDDTSAKDKEQWKGEVPSSRYSDFGGIESIIRDIQILIDRPLKNSQVYKHLGLEPPKGVLLFGPPGCGKTALASAIAGELGLPLIKIAGPEIVSGMSGESEGKLREIFSAASAQAPCILFLDEIDAITPKRETAQKEMERRIVAQLLSCLDDLAASVVVIGATNRPDSLDPALRRAGRFDHELKMPIPDTNGRSSILRVVCEKLKLDGAVDFESIANRTPGFVGADLRALSREAASIAIDRILSGTTETLGPEILSLFSITLHDFEVALTRIQPSAKREGFAVIPNVSWSDVGALFTVREELRMAVVEPIKNPKLYASFGLSSPAGILLWGPPGCGKTLLAKAIANETHSNFISVKGPELLNKYVGESERAVRQVFERARASSPCVVFFDELDSLCPKRGSDSDSSSARVVNQLLTELDGLEGRKGVFILAATNRPDMIDSAILRPGRLDKLLYVGLPDADERFDILKAISKNTPWADDIDLKDISSDKMTTGYTGADLSALVKESSINAIRDLINSNSAVSLVSRRHVDTAVSKIVPSVSQSDLRTYENLRNVLNRI